MSPARHTCTLLGTNDFIQILRMKPFSPDRRENKEGNKVARFHWVDNDVYSLRKHSVYNPYII